MVPVPVLFLPLLRCSLRPLLAAAMQSLWLWSCPCDPCCSSCLCTLQLWLYLHLLSCHPAAPRVRHS